MSNSQIDEIVDYLDQLKEDPDTHKKFKEKADEVIVLLTSNVDLAVEKSLLTLEELNSLDLNSYHRTQVWDVISMLEGVNAR